MADWSASIPDLVTSYTLVLVDLQARDVDAYTLAESPTNPPTGAIRYLRASDKFQEWSGAVWVDKLISIAGGGTGSGSAAGARTNLGLGSMALQNNNAVTITGGSITGLTTLDAPSAASGGAWQFNGAAPQLSLVNGTSNWIAWAALGAVAPAFTTRSIGTKLVLYPNISPTLADFAVGIEPGAVWHSVPSTGQIFNWYHGTQNTLQLSYSVGAQLQLTPGQNVLGSKFAINILATADAPGILMSGEPGVSVSNVILANNYISLTGGSSGRINTSIGGSYLQLINDGTITFNRITAGGVASQSGRFTNAGNFVANSSIFVGVGYTFSSDATCGISHAGATLDFTVGGVTQVLIGTLGTMQIANNTNSIGPALAIGRSTSTPAGGFIQFLDKSGAQWSIFVDTSGRLRIVSGTGPATSTDTIGTVVGTQT